MMNKSRINILVVEDDLLIAENLKAILEDLGYAVAETCGTEKEAMEMLGQQAFDLALLDIHLNGHDEGIAIAKSIASNYHFPCIFLTAFSDKETIAKAATARPSAYLVKPASPSALFAAIQTALHNFQDNRVSEGINEPANDLSFFVKLGNRISKIEWAEVVSITAGKNYVILQVNKSNLPEFPIRGTLQQAIGNLIPESMKKQFIQISRSHCINIAYVQQIEHDRVITPLGSFEIGEKYRKELIDRLGIVH